MVAACPYPTTQGTQVYVRDMVRALDRRGHEVHVVTYHFGEDLPTWGRIHRIPRVPGYRKLRAGPAAAKPLLDALLLGRLLHVAKKHRLDLLHAHNYEAPLAAYAVRALTGIPAVYNSHNLMADELHAYFRRPGAQRAARHAAFLLDRSVPRGADRVIAISPPALPALRDCGVPPERLDLLLPAVHPEDFPGTEAARPRDPSRPTLVYAGNPDGYQDLPLLFRAAVRIARFLPGFRLLLVSGACLRERVRDALAAGVPPGCLETRVTADFAQVRAALRESDVAALPRTLCRGFPVKLLNYMASGLPVVASRGSAHAVDDGRTGRVVADGDAEAFARAAIDLLVDPAASRRMGEAARSSIHLDWTWERRVLELEAVYARTLTLAQAGGLR
jgi:glycosyltransferase involved in cell wall biosynthesis